MTWRWDDDAYDAAESHGQHVEGSLDWYSSWGGPLGGQVFAAADRLASLSSRLVSAPEGLTSGSSPAQGHTCKASIYDPVGITQSCALPLGHHGPHDGSRVAA